MKTASILRFPPRLHLLKWCRERELLDELERAEFMRGLLEVRQLAEPAEPAEDYTGDPNPRPAA